MPSAIKYIPPTSIERNAFNSEVAEERRTRRKNYQTALEYYLGEHPEQLKYDPNDPDDPNDNTTINLVQMTADRTCSFLFPSVPEFETDPKSVEDTPEEVWIKKFFDYNGGLQSLIKLALRGFLSGHAFVRIKPAPKNKRANKTVFPTMTILDPTMVSVYWKADDVADVLWYEMRYTVGDTAYIQDFIKEEEKERWVIKTYRATTTTGSVNNFPGKETVHGSANVIALDQLDFGAANGVFELVETAIHASTISPIIEFAHLPHPDDYYGLGEFTQQNLQDTINRVMSLRNRIVRENADPVDVVTGSAPDDVEPSDGLITIANPNSRVTRLELKGDLAGINSVLDKLIETYLAIARVVLLKGEAKDLQRVTNASVRTLFLDALSKNSILQSAYGTGLTRMIKLALLMGFEAGHDITNPVDIDLKIKFPIPLPVDDTEIANQNTILVGLGARSKRTAATKMGDDWNFELAAMEAEQEMANEQAQVQGDIAAENAKKMSDAVPQPAPTSGGFPAKKPAGKPVPPK